MDYTAQRRRDSGHIFLGASIAGCISALILYLAEAPILAIIVLAVSLGCAGQAHMHGVR
jgi:hypothetical protein